MVAKRFFKSETVTLSYLLAKIHMVAKLMNAIAKNAGGYLLAKIHMVAKLTAGWSLGAIGYLLAKIHMVAKLTWLTEKR